MERKPKVIKIACWNMRGFNSSIPYLRSLCKQADIIALSEHWLHENKIKRIEEVSNDFLYCARASSYSSAENYGTKRGQGGVAILWNKKLGGVSPISGMIHDRMCGIRLQTESNLIFNIVSIYLPAQGSPDSYSECLDDLSDFINAMEFGSKTIICGDANGDMGYLAGDKSVREPTKRGKALYDFITARNLVATNMQKSCQGPINTHIGPTGSTTIDYVLIPGELLCQVENSKVFPEEILNCSDHNPIVASINIGALLPTTVEVKPSRIPKWNKLSGDDIKNVYTNVVEREMADVLTLTYVGQIQSPGGIDSAMEKIVQVLTNASKTIPTNKFRPNLKPYWNQDLSDLKSLKIDKYKAWVSEGRPRTTASTSWREHKAAKKHFASTLKRISKEYENRQMIEAVESCSTDKTIFWRHLKKCKSTGGSRVLAIKNHKDEVVYEIKDILTVWSKHFAALSTPKSHSSYDEDHFNQTNEKVEQLDQCKDSSPFTDCPVVTKEVQKAVNKLKKNKSCGCDGISAEHVKYGGTLLIITLTLIFNLIFRFEYIPVNFRRGTQIPLFKGKNLCSTDTNNYRGITLLSTFSKIYELVIWDRIEPWWRENGALSRFQGACRKGQSCVHTSLLLQETVASALEAHKKVFVSYFDVSKAFDTVWTNGLFSKLHDIGITGKMWRLMYRTYNDFYCKVRISGNFSEWYPMSCGIHQGGILLLIKYIVFINGLLIELEKSELCCRIALIPSSPAGYADGLAAVTISKNHTDKVHDIVYKYGKKWRFNFNAGKSGVMVYGENKKTNAFNHKHRVFRLGQEWVKEKDSYDHVGIKVSIFNDCNLRVEEKLAKGRKTLNASTGLGIRKNGLTMIT